MSREILGNDAIASPAAAVRRLPLARRISGVRRAAVGVLAALFAASPIGAARAWLGAQEADAPGASVRVALVCAAPGPLRVDLIDEAAFADLDRPLARLTALIGSDDVARPLVVEFGGLKPGNYALRAFVDVDGDGRLDRGLWGPTEPWALSWVAEAKRAIPKFSDIAFSVETGTTAVRMEVRRW